MFFFHFFQSNYPVLPTNNPVAVENVLVDESGDDSEDEWDYVKVNKEKAEQERNTEGAEAIGAKGNDIDSLNVGQDQEARSPTLSALSVDEKELVVEQPFTEQSHTIAQALVEPEETCGEVTYRKIHQFSFFI